MKTHVWTEYECPYGGALVACVRLDAESFWERLQMALYVLRNGFIGSIRPADLTKTPAQSTGKEKTDECI